MISDMLSLLKEEDRTALLPLLTKKLPNDFTDNEETLFFIHLLVYYKFYHLDFDKIAELNRLQLCRLSDIELQHIYDAIDLTELHVQSGKNIFIDISDELLAFSNHHVHRIAHLRKHFLASLNPTDYEHPWDRQYLAILKNVKGLDFVCEKITEFGIEPYIRINYTGSNIQVTPKIMPELYSVFEEACAILDMPIVPDFYIEQGFINAFTVGCTNPLIVLDSGALPTLSRNELLYIIGHELGHIKSNHCLYHMMGDALPFLTDMAGNVTLGLSNILSFGMRLALSNWKRMSEFTADRAGLLCCQDINAALSVFMKLSGLPIIYYKTIHDRIEGFIEQAETFASLDTGIQNKLIKFASIINQDHPWMIIRAKELLAWYKNGEYEKHLHSTLLLKSNVNAELQNQNGSIAESIREIKSSEPSKVDQLYSSVKNNVSEAVDSVANCAEEAVDTIKNGVENAVDGVKDGFSSAVDNVGDAVEDVKKGVSDAVDSVGNMFKKAKFW